MIVNSAQFDEVFLERFPKKKAIPLTKIEEIKSFLQNYSQNLNKKTQAEKVHAHNWFSDTISNNLVKMFTCFTLAIIVVWYVLDF